MTSLAKLAQSFAVKISIAAGEAVLQFNQLNTTIYDLLKSKNQWMSIIKDPYQQADVEMGLDNLQKMTNQMSNQLGNGIRPEVYTSHLQGVKSIADELAKETADTTLLGKIRNIQNKVNSVISADKHLGIPAQKSMAQPKAQPASTIRTPFAEHPTMELPEMTIAPDSGLFSPEYEVPGEERDTGVML